MSEQTSQEPTMEEILASIRRIFSEDDAPAADAAETAPAATELPEALEAAAPADEPVEESAVEDEPAPVVDADEDDDALELTEKVETVGDLDVYTPGPAEEPPAPPAPPPQAAIETLVSERAATAAASAFGQLSAAVSMPKGDRTLEDVVRELLRPLLQQWLDENLPAIVQQAVETEVERIARGRAR